MLAQPLPEKGSLRRLHHRYLKQAAPDPFLHLPLDLADTPASTLDLWKPLLADSSKGIDAVVRNRVLQRPGDSAPADVVDEVWLADEAVARSLGEPWQALFEEGRLKPLLASGSGFVLLARENVLFAGSSGT